MISLEKSSRRSLAVAVASLPGTEAQCSPALKDQRVDQRRLRRSVENVVVQEPLDDHAGKLPVVTGQSVGVAQHRFKGWGIAASFVFCREQ